MQPLYIKVHARDNVAIVVSPEGLPAGTACPDGPTLTERIPQSHKVALRDFEAGEPVIRYGQVIGLALRPIRAGSWIREDVLEL
ncbi:MAG: UxaA family hydrolase, partial [Bryobacteraceae bacterium]